MELIGRSRKLLEDTVAGNAEAVAKAIEEIRGTQYAPTFYNDEQALRYVIKFAYIAAIDQYMRLTAESLAYGAMSGPVFETFVVSEILKSFSNEGLDYRHFVSYYRGRDKKKVKENGEIRQLESEIDLIIEENGILYPVEIKKYRGQSNHDVCIFGTGSNPGKKERHGSSCMQLPGCGGAS